MLVYLTFCFEISEQVLKRKVEDSYLKKSKLRNNASDGFLCTLFRYKTTSKTSNDNTIYNVDVDHEIQIQKLNKEIDQLLKLTSSMQSQLTITCECLQEKIEKRTAEESDKKELLK